MKISFIGMISIFSLPFCIKNRRWILWERRQLFLDDKESCGFPTAYRWAKRYIRQLQGEQ